MSGAQQNDEANVSLGKWFKSARELRGESLENVSAITRISKNYLEAIEEDQLEKLPSQAYTKGFIRLYANHLGLSGEEALLRTDRNYEQKTEETEQNNIGKTTDNRSDKSASYRSLRKWAIPFFLLLTVSLFAALPALKQSKSSAPGREQASPPHLPAPAEHPAATTLPSQQAFPDPKPVDIAPESPAREDGSGIILRLKAVQDGKIHITIDGAISQEYELKNGDIIEWKAEKIFLLELDNAGSVEGELNGVRMKPFGESGKAAQMTIRADALQPQ